MRKLFIYILIILFGLFIIQKTRLFILVENAKSLDNSICEEIRNEPDFEDLANILNVKCK